MPLIVRQRSRLAVLAVLALVGSLLAVSAVPVVAAEAEAEASAEAEFSACVDAATEDAGYTDVIGDTQEAVNCLAHYGITKGRAGGIYEPRESIKRQQMALFMHRAAGPAGIEMDDTEDQGLTDIGDFSDEVQEAINQVAKLEIMGATIGDDTTFEPNGLVTRASMAVILDGFLTAAGVDLDEVAGVAKDEDLEVDEPFTDLGRVYSDAETAINRMYEFGVAEGNTDGTFNPNGLVSRGQMAKFVTRALGHTNARPEGLSIQGPDTGTEAGDITVTVSLREDGEPVSDAQIDVFSFEDQDEAFDDDGACEPKKARDNGGLASTTSGACKIGDLDDETDALGNVAIDVELVGKAGSTTLFAWTGDIRDTFDLDETDYKVHDVTVTEPAEQSKASKSSNDHSTKVRFGEEVTITIQLVDNEGDPVDLKGASYSLSAVLRDTSPDANGNADDLTDNEDGENGLRTDQSTTTSTGKTDASGRLELAYSPDDPDPDEDNQDEITLTLTITKGDDAEAFADGSDRTEPDDPATSDDSAVVTVKWSDTDSVATTLVLDQTINYHKVDDDGVTNTVTATLLDQYGDPISGKSIDFWSDDFAVGGGLGTAGSESVPSVEIAEDRSNAKVDETTKRTTGVAKTRYTRTLETFSTEMISARYYGVVGCDDRLADDADDPCTDIADEEDIDIHIDGDSDTGMAAIQALTHYWAIPGVTMAATADAVDILVVDKDNDTIVTGDDDADTAEVSVYTYSEDDDVLFVNNVPKSAEDFEVALDDAGTLRVKLNTDNANEFYFFTADFGN